MLFNSDKKSRMKHQIKKTMSKFYYETSVHTHSCKKLNYKLLVLYDFVTHT